MEPTQPALEQPINRAFVGVPSDCSARSPKTPPRSPLSLPKLEDFGGSPWEKVKLDEKDLYQKFNVAPGKDDSDQWDSKLDDAYENALLDAHTSEERAMAQGGYLLLKNPELKQKYDRVLELLQRLQQGILAEQLFQKKPNLFKRKKLSSKPIRLSLSKDLSSMTLAYNDGSENLMTTFVLSEIMRVATAEQAMAHYKLSSADLQRSLQMATKREEVYLRLADHEVRETFIFMLRQFSPLHSS